ncbi:unnamed protein product, partial [Rotaria socialis]
MLMKNYLIQNVRNITMVMIKSDRKRRRILEEINLPVSILSTPPTPTYTERIL